MKPSAQALIDYMSELSEAAYSASWMAGLEFSLWKALSEGPMRYGQLDITKDHIAKLQTLSDTCGGWIVFEDKTHETFVPLDEWRMSYSAR